MAERERKTKIAAALVYPFLALAIVGSVATLMIHVASLFGITDPFEHYLKFVGPGVFVVFLPMIFVINRLTRDYKQKDLWRAALRGCPSWMRHAVWVIFGYAWVGFFALPFLYGGGMSSSANSARSMSAMLLVFYVIPVAVLYSATHVQDSDASRRCLNGHLMPPLAKFCPECGAPLAPQGGNATDSL
ncbi:MAG: zinc ribbon domain-containing protein [Silvibacterium sp.]